MNKTISWPLFKENLKRFWGFGAVIFMAYFLSTNFILLMEMDHLYDNTVFNLVSSSNFGYLFFDVATPIISAAIMFSYLAKVNSTTAMHTMPFSRKSLFLTNYFSGLLLIVLPVAVNSLITICLRPMVVNANVFGSSGSIAKIFTVKAILFTLLWNFVIMLFTYSISVLAGMVSGNTIIHILTAGAMNFILPVMWLAMMGYGELFLYGFDFSDNLWEQIGTMHPVMYGVIHSFVGYNYQIGWLTIAIYIAVAIAISVIAYIFYQKRELERAGDSYVFKFIKYIIAFIFTFIPATGMAVLMVELNHGLWIGLAIGGFVGFIIGWMIINKSFKIFNLKGLVTFIICAAITLLVALGFKFDILGFEKRVPNEENIDSVSYSCSYVGNDWWDEEVRTADNIRNLRGIHQGIIDLKDDPREGEGFEYMSIIYNLKNGKTMTRRYLDIPIEFFNGNTEFKSVFESKEINQYADEFLMYNPENMHVSLNSSINYYLDEMQNTMFNVNDNTEFKKEFITALAADLSERTYEEAISHKIPLISLYLSEVVPGSKLHDYDACHYISMNQSLNYDNGQTECVIDSSIDINEDYERTMAVLAKYGLLDYMIPNEKTGFITLSKPDYSTDDGVVYAWGTKASDSYVGLPESNDEFVVVSDTDLQQAILSNDCFTGITKITNKNDRLHMFYAAYEIEYEYGENGIQPSFKISNRAYELYNAWVDYSKLPVEVQKLVDQYL